VIKKLNITNYFNKISIFVQSNIKLIIYFIILFFFIIIFYQYYLYQKDKKILNLSILYDKAKNNINTKDFSESMNLIAKENGIYGLFASLELIKVELNNKNYLIAYEYYLEILKENKLKNIYNSIVALHAAYNLTDYLSSDKIKKLLSFIDLSNNSFKGYNDEILFMLAIKDQNLEVKDILSNKILNDENISFKIKERIRKLNEIDKYQ